MDEDLDWRYIDEFPDYVVFEDGRIKKERSDRFVALRKNQQGINMVGLSKRGYGASTRAVDRIVCTAFWGDPPEDGLQSYSPCHIDGDRSNDNASNLMWRPRWWATEWHKMLKSTRPMEVNDIQNLRTGEVYRDTLEAGIELKLLEKEVIHAANNQDWLAWSRNL